MRDRRSTLPPDADQNAATAAQVVVPVADLCRAPDGPRDRQLVFGQTVTQYGTQSGWSLIRADRDGYVGYVRAAALGASTGATHWITALATQVYQAADFKSPDLMTLSFGSPITVTDQSAKFATCTTGFVPLVHLAPVGVTLSDPVAVAQMFLGTPYLWGGNSRLGIDCSGLVQAACLACGLDCPGDSDQQQALLGVDAATGARPQRGDVLFWKGHVALVADADTILHANAHSMSVCLEPMAAAIERISAQGDGDVTAHKRLMS